GLARPGLSDHGHDLAPGDLQRASLEDVDRGPRDRETAPQVVQAQQGAGRNLRLLEGEEVVHRVTPPTSRGPAPRTPRIRGRSARRTPRPAESGPPPGRRGSTRRAPRRPPRRRCPTRPRGPGATRPRRRGGPRRRPPTPVPPSGG